MASHREKLISVPNVHRNPAITPRPPVELKKRADEAVKLVDSNLNAHIIGFLEWLVHDRTDPPARPEQPIPKDGAGEAAVVRPTRRKPKPTV
jgi:hypothetical protein